MVQILQVACGLAWLIPLVLFAPAVLRIWKAPMRGPARPDPLDVLVSPMFFFATIQVGFTIRWIFFPHAIAYMQELETIVWSGLYVLSIIVAAGSVLAWRIARRIG